MSLYRVVASSGARTAVFYQLAIECHQHHICNHANNCSLLESDNFQSSLVVTPLQSSVLVHLGIIFLPKGFCGLDLSVKA